MLYGMDDHEDKYVEYGLVKTKKLNIKKIIIFIMVILACFLLIFGSFYISYNNISNNKDFIAVEESNFKELTNLFSPIIFNFTFSVVCSKDKNILKVYLNVKHVVKSNFRESIYTSLKPIT